MKIKGLLDPRLRGDDNKASFRMRTSYTLGACPRIGTYCGKAILARFTDHSR
jgi:hypothetical protein